MTPIEKSNLKKNIKNNVGTKKNISTGAINPNPLGDYISLSMDLVKLEGFLIENLTLPKEKKEQFFKEHMEPLIERTENRIDLLKEITKKFKDKQNNENN